MPDINEPFVISRNSVDKILHKFKVVKGDNKEKEYLAPAFSIEEFDADAKWFGIPNIVNALQRIAKTTFQSMWFESFNEDGSFNWQKFTKEATDFTSAGLTIKQIDEQMDELQAKQMQLITLAETDETGLFVNVADVLAIKQLKDDMVALRAMREQRSHKPKEVNAEASVEVRS